MLLYYFKCIHTFHISKLYFLFEKLLSFCNQSVSRHLQKLPFIYSNYCEIALFVVCQLFVNVHINYL